MGRKAYARNGCDPAPKFLVRPCETLAVVARLGGSKSEGQEIVPIKPDVRFFQVREAEDKKAGASRLLIQP